MMALTGDKVKRRRLGRRGDAPDRAGGAREALPIQNERDISGAAYMRRWRDPGLGGPRMGFTGHGSWWLRRRCQVAAGKRVAAENEVEAAADD